VQVVEKMGRRCTTRNCANLGDRSEGDGSRSDEKGTDLQTSITNIEINLEVKIPVLAEV